MRGLNADWRNPLFVTFFWLMEFCLWAGSIWLCKVPAAGFGGGRVSGIQVRATPASPDGLSQGTTAGAQPASGRTVCGRIPTADCRAGPIPGPVRPVTFASAWAKAARPGGPALRGRPPLSWDGNLSPHPPPRHNRRGLANSFRRSSGRNYRPRGGRQGSPSWSL